MTRAQAQIAFKDGEKIKHKYFSLDEFIVLKDNKMVDEKGFTLNKREFWLARGSKQFDDGWEII